MRDVEVKMNRFKLKKLLALSVCAVMAMGVITMPVSAAEDETTSEGQIKPTGAGGSYSGDAESSVWMATGDAKDPTKVIDFIKNAESKNIYIDVNEETQTLPKAVFQAAKDGDKKLSFTNKDKNGKPVTFNFKSGIKNDVDMNFGIEVTMDNELVKNLKDESAVVFNFAHSGVLPGSMEVGYYNEAYKDNTATAAFLYLLNEKTGKLEKQEQKVTVDRAWMTFTIEHCSSYVTTLTEIAETKLQVAEPKADAPKATEAAKDDAIKATGSQAAAFQTIALLTLCGAAVVIATKKEKKA